MPPRPNAARQPGRRLQRPKRGAPTPAPQRQRRPTGAANSPKSCSNRHRIIAMLKTSRSTSAPLKRPARRGR
eukprot:10523445-Lingulodinium_polyedra.AAC.1